MRTRAIPFISCWLGLLLGGVIFLYFPVQAFAINNFSFDTSSKDASLQQAIDVPIHIHTETGVQVVSADVRIIYDPAYFDIQNYEEGTFFTTIVDPQTPSPGIIYIAGLFDDVTSTKSGDGLVATLTFIPKKTGTTQFKYDCRGNTVNDTSKINVDFSNPQNVIDCSSTVANILTVNITDSSGLIPTPTGGTEDTETTTPETYLPGDTTLTPTPSVLPNSGFFDNTLYYVLSGGLMVGVGEVLRRLYSRPF